SAAATSQVKSVVELASDLFDLARNGPLLLYVSSALDHVSSNSLLALGRCLWALSLERTMPSHVGIVLTEEIPDTPFRLTIALSPLDEPGSKAVVHGILGAAELQTELIARLHALTGGNPGILR